MTTTTTKPTAKPTQTAKENAADDLAAVYEAVKKDCVIPNFAAGVMANLAGEEGFGRDVDFNSDSAKAFGAAIGASVQPIEELAATLKERFDQIDNDKTAVTVAQAACKTRGNAGGRQ